MARNRLCRSSDAKIMGVCAGISKWLDVDVSLVRLGFIIGSFITGGVLCFIYLGLGIFLPVEDRGSETIFDKFKDEYVTTSKNRGRKRNNFTVDDVKSEFDNLKDRVSNMEDKVFNKEKDWDDRFKNS